MLIPLNVATPLTAFCVNCPVSVPLPTFVSNDRVIACDDDVIVAPLASCTVTRIPDATLIVLPAWVVVGCVVKPNFTAGPIDAALNALLVAVLFVTAGLAVARS